MPRAAPAAGGQAPFLPSRVCGDASEPRGAGWGWGAGKRQMELEEGMGSPAIQPLGCRAGEGAAAECRCPCAGSLPSPAEALVPASESCLVPACTAISSTDAPLLLSFLSLS